MPDYEFAAGLGCPRVEDLDTFHGQISGVSGHDGEVVNECRGRQQAINHG